MQMLMHLVLAVNKMRLLEKGRQTSNLIYSSLA